ncbi:MAG TPA: hypothetical protein VHG93_28585 [Longimicrobium sp.]|nr:hypothetical protein [Longimicrobium sp.]
MSTHANPFVGSWTYRSFYNDPDLHLDKNGNADFNAVQLGFGTIVIEEIGPQELGGTIGGDGWSLDLHGSMSVGNPGQVRFQGKGWVGGNLWMYDYIGWLVPVWPNGIDQRRALVGSIVRDIDHPSGSGGISPAGVVGSWYAVLQD